MQQHNGYIDIAQAAQHSSSVAGRIHCVYAPTIKAITHSAYTSLMHVLLYAIAALRSSAATGAHFDNLHEHVTRHTS
jgi:hypothetical protein